MKVDEALEKWADACSAAQVSKGVFVRNGNWETLARALRHSKDATLQESGELNGDKVVLVTPAAPAEPAEVPKGKTPIVRPPFYLVVK